MAETCRHRIVAIQIGACSHQKASKFIVGVPDDVSTREFFGYHSGEVGSDGIDGTELFQAATDNCEDETCKTFVLSNEDHTLGNSLRYIIMKNPDVQFCGYSVPHPSEAKINFRIQTHGPSATDVLKKGLKDLHGVCEHVLRTFETSVNEHKRRNQSKDIEMADQSGQG